MPVLKRLDAKLARIRTRQATRSDFIVADAKDADMGFGLTAPGPRDASRAPAGPWRCPRRRHRRDADADP